MAPRSRVFLSSCALAVAIVGGAFGCSSNDNTPPGTGSSGTIDNDGGGGGGEGGGTPDVQVPIGTANTILGLSSTGEIVRVGIGQDGVDTVLGYPKLAGKEVRTIGAIASGGGSLFAIDYGENAGRDKTLVRINPISLEMTPQDSGFGLRTPQKKGLGFGGASVFGSGQFGPISKVGIDGKWEEYIVRQNNTAVDTTQCHTPEDLFFDGALLGAGTCAGPEAASRNATYFVWEYLLGKPGTTGQGGELTDKSIRYTSPERILGLGRAGVLVATSAQRSLMVLSGSSFVIVRKLAMTIEDLE